MFSTSPEDVTRMIHNCDPGTVISPASPHHLPEPDNLTTHQHYYMGVDIPDGLIDQIRNRLLSFATPGIPHEPVILHDVAALKSATAPHVTIHGGGSEHYGSISGDVNIPVNDNIDVHVGGGGSYWQDQQHNLHTGGGHWDGGVTFKF